MNFREIYDQHKNLVYNLSLHYTQSIQDAEEVSQDVFLSVYQNLNKFKAQSEMRTWIYRITVNKSLDFLKSKKRKKRSSFLRATSLEDYHVPSNRTNDYHPGIELEQKEAMQGLFAAINQLPDRQKNVLILLKIEGLSQKQTAEILELSTKAVESLFQRAKKNLEQALEKAKEKS